MTNYHNEEVQFTVGQNVTHVTDAGEMIKANITKIENEYLELKFGDGEQGIEKANTCF